MAGHRFMLCDAESTREVLREHQSIVESMLAKDIHPEVRDQLENLDESLDTAIADVMGVVRVLRDVCDREDAKQLESGSDERS